MMDWIAPIASANTFPQLETDQLFHYHFWRRCSGNLALCYCKWSCLFIYEADGLYIALR